MIEEAGGPFVVGVAFLALAFGFAWLWYHFAATPRERSERRRQGWRQKAERQFGE